MKDFPIIKTEVYKKPCSVIQSWVNELSFKQQTVLLAALRGCDGVQKHDTSKPYIKGMRATLLHNADPNEPFMKIEITQKQFDLFIENIDHYPMHWLFHFAHAAEIIGYKHPQIEVKEWWIDFYNRLMEALHVNPETETQLDKRLADKDKKNDTLYIG